MNVLELFSGTESFSKPFDIIWASPPCNCFSVASIGKNWVKRGNGIYRPKRKEALDAINLLRATRALIKSVNPRFIIIENPRGMMRKMRTATYCQYGDSRQKPTDLWTNFYFKARSCRPRASCHEPAPRGSRTGTQGLKGSVARSVVPPALCNEILDAIEKEVSSNA